MINRKRKIPSVIKRLLVDKAGGKCANPGCTNWRSHIHHIRHWAVYKTHDCAHMIAICPSCHDAVHHGTLEITDDTLYRWKRIPRSSPPETTHIFIEPAAELRLLTGTIAFATTSDQAAIFELSNKNQLSFRVLDGDILLVTSRIVDNSGSEVLRIVDNHVRVSRGSEITFDFHAGHARVTVPATENFIPMWLVTQMRRLDPQFAADQRIIAVEVEVLKPGLIRVAGCWSADDRAIVITRDALVFCDRDKHATPIIGAGEDSLIKWQGPIHNAIFGFAPNTSAAVVLP